MSKILMSIKPEYANKIFDGTKKYEYRKTVPKEKVNKIIVYSSYPVKKVIGEIEIEYILKDAKEIVWNKTKDYSGVTKKKYDDYYKNKKFAIAYKISKIVKYQSVKELENFGIKTAPQSYIYIDD